MESAATNDFIPNGCECDCTGPEPCRSLLEPTTVKIRTQATRYGLFTTTVYADGVLACISKGKERPLELVQLAEALGARVDYRSY